MLLGMNEGQISEWVTNLDDDVHELVRATAVARSRADAEAMLGEALVAIEELYARMLRAEVRAIVAGGAKVGG